MHHELHAMERQAMEAYIHTLEAQLDAMQADFAKCAKDNISPCFFCENDEICNGCPDNCNFKWHVHI